MPPLYARFPRRDRWLSLVCSVLPAGTAFDGFFSIMDRQEQKPDSGVATMDQAKILIADDNPQGVELLEAYLDGLGCEIRLAYDGEQTLKAVKEWHPDLILLDIMMPRISGFEVCKRLRSDPATSDVAILMVTALDQPSDVERAVEAGTDDFLTKPINKLELLLRVKSMLKGRMYKRQLDRALAYFTAVEQGARK